MGHSANGKPAVSPEARKRFFKLRNVQKWSLRERESGRFAGGEETFFRLRNVGKMFISRMASRPFRQRRENAFSSFETYKNGHLANGNPADSPVARKRFSGSETSENGHFANDKPFRLRNVGKMVIPRTASRPFRRRRENAFSSSETSKNGHFTNGYQSAGIHSHFTYRELCGRGIFIICFVILRW